MKCCKLVAQQHSITILQTGILRSHVLGCDGVQFDRCGCPRRRNHLHLQGRPWLHTITPQQTTPCYSNHTTGTALFLLWYLYVCLRSSNTVAWFYLFLRYFYYQHMSLYIFFTPLNYASSLPNASTVNAQFIYQFSSKSLTYRNLTRPFRYY
jgi:hypothetical protein